MNSASPTVRPASPKSTILHLSLPEDFAAAVHTVYASLKGTTRDASTHEEARTAISYNDSNPSAWVLLRESAEALAETDANIWESEAAYTTTIITQSAKNYQAWEHRRFAASKSGLLEAELEFCEMALDNNPKNYHAWAHRAWVVRQGITDGEDESTEWYIRKDVRNNSAWNHRWLVVGPSKGEKEMEFVVGMIGLAPRNEAVWNYALALSQAGVGKDAAVLCAKECIEDDPGCIPARRFLVLLGEDVSNQCEILASIDTVRSSYWRGREKGFTDPQT